LNQKSSSKAGLKNLSSSKEKDLVPIRQNVKNNSHQKNQVVDKKTAKKQNVITQKKGVKQVKKVDNDIR